MEPHQLIDEVHKQVEECRNGITSIDLSLAPTGVLVEVFVKTLEDSCLSLRFSADGVDAVASHFDCLHSALLHLSKGYARWYFSSVAARLEASADDGDGEKM